MDSNVEEDERAHKMNYSMVVFRIYQFYSAIAQIIAG